MTANAIHASRLPAMLTRARSWAVLGTLSLVAFVLSHQLVFLHTWGNAYGDALRRSGHGGPWTFAMLTVAVLTAALALAAIRECVRLAARARELENRHGTFVDERPAALLGPMLRLWLLVLPGATALFVLAENVEHLAVGAPLPGLSVLGSTEYYGPLPILMLVSLLVAFIGALFGWRRALLLARIRANRTGFVRPAPQQPSADGTLADRRPETHIGRGLAGRAPPVLLPS
jgi:hypothetical protein